MGFPAKSQNGAGRDSALSQRGNLCHRPCVDQWPNLHILVGAISDFEKALALRPGHVPALESLLVLCAAEKDWRGVMSAEERLLAALPSDTMRFERLIEFASRWEGIAEKPQRAKVLFERANVLRPNDPIVTTQIRRITNKSFFPPKA